MDNGCQVIVSCSIIHTFEPITVNGKLISKTWDCMCVCVWCYTFQFSEVFKNFYSYQVDSISFWYREIIFRLSNLLDLFDQYDSQMTLPVLVKWACFRYIWELLIDCLMLIMMRFTSRECQCTKERYILQLSHSQCYVIFKFSYSYLAIVVQIWRYFVAFLAS